MRPMLERSAALAVALAIAGCGGGEPTHRLIVAVDLAASASVCDDPTGIDLEGTPVRVRDEAGEELASARLGPGGPPTGWVPGYRIRTCRFQAVVEVPDLQTYSVVVDEGPAVTFTRADLEFSRWTAVYPPTELPGLEG